MTGEGYVPRQRTGEDNERIIKRIGEIELEMRYDGSPSPLKRHLDEQYGPDGWGTREAAPETTVERIYQNMGLLILEVYEK